MPERRGPSLGQNRAGHAARIVDVDQDIISDPAMWRGQFYPASHAIRMSRVTGIRSSVRAILSRHLGPRINASS